MPTLRFPGFTDEWEKMSIGSIASKVGSGSTPRGGSAIYEEKGRPFVRSQNIGNGFLLLDDIVHISEEIHNQQKNTEIIEQDVMLNITGASIGRCAIADTRIAGGNVNQHVCIIRSTSLNPIFLSNYILSHRGQKQIESFQAGGNREGLNFEQVRSIRLNVPQRKEQDKISSLLTLLDERIALQSKLIDRLKSLMDGIVVKHWKGVEKGKYCLSDLGEAFSVMNLSKDDLTEDGKYCIIYGELFTTYDAIIDNVVSHTDKVDRLTLSGDNDLLFPASTTVNAYSLISPSAIIKRDVVLGGDMFGIHISPEHSAEYISLIINAIYRNKLSKYAKGSTIIHLHYSDIKNVQIELPELEMQLYLVGVVKRLRAKLSIETDYLTALNNVKQSLLSAMFI